MDINLLGVPIMYGCDRNGAQYGPDKLREKGIIDIIENQNYNIYDLGNLFIPKIPERKKFSYHNNVKYLKPIVEINTNLAHLVYSSLSANSFPFIIGGDHSLGLGSIAGTTRFYNNVAVIWIDAHGDINTYETSPSGNAHGMPLAASFGVGEPSLTKVYYNEPKVLPENVYIIGARDLDKGEIELAKNLDLKLYTMDKVEEIGIDSVIHEVLYDINSKDINAVHLSFDIDVIDKSLVPGTGTPVSNGFSLKETKNLLKGFLSTGLVKSMDFVELNPLLDKDDTTADLCIDLIDWIFKVIVFANKVKAK